MEDSLYTSVDNQSMSTHFGYPANNIKFVVPNSRQLRYSALKFFLSISHRMYLQCIDIAFHRHTYFKELPLMQTIRSISSTPDAVSCTSLGTPGPYNKYSVLLMTPEGTPILITKVGPSDKTQLLLKNEAHWLQRLASIPPLNGQTPKLLDYRIVIGHALLSQTPCNDKVASIKFTKEHISFLNRFQAACTSNVQFENSGMELSIRKRAQMLVPLVDDKWERRIVNSIWKIKTILGNSNVLMTAAHRDFVHWNIRKGPNGVYVFDWEYAAEEYIPLYDIFSFLIMPRVLRNRLHVTDIPILLKRTRDIALQLDDNGRKCNQLPAQLLAYLLDVCLFYLESNNGAATGDVVVSRYGILMDELCSTLKV